MIKGAQYFFDSEIDVKSLIQMAITGRAIAEDYETLSKNFVSANEKLIKTPPLIDLKCSGGITFQKATQTYYSTTAGYVQYGDRHLTIIPFLNLSDNHDVLTALVPQKKSTNAQLSFAIISNMIQAMGIATSILDEKINRILELYEGDGGSVELAKSEPPINSRPAIIELLYQIQSNVGTEDQSGKINYKDKHFVNNIKVGQLIASYTPPLEPKRGVDLFANIIPAIEENPDTYIMGAGLELREEEGKIYAAIEGVLNISEKNEISVSDCEIIKGNVDINVGNLDVNGSLLVKGDICPGMKIKTKRNITVEGNVEESDIICGKKLVVLGGIIGNEETSIEADGDIEAGYINNAAVKCRANLIVRQYIMNSNVTASGNVVANHPKKGKIVGGVVSGSLGVETSFAGNKSGIKTTIITGLDIDREERLKALNDESKTNNQNILKLKNALGNGYFQDPSGYLKRLPSAKIQVIKQIINNLKKCVSEKRRLDEELSKLAEMSVINRDATITILQEAAAGTILQIGQKHKVLENNVPAATRYIYDREQSDVIPSAIK